MRPVVWATFLAIALVILGLGVVPLSGDRKPRQPTMAERFRGVKPPVPLDTKPHEITVNLKGEKRTLPDDAKAEVITQARLKVNELFLAQRPSIDWTPSVEQADSLLADWKVDAVQVRELGTMHEASATFRLSPDAQRQLLAQWHEETAGRRQWWLAAGTVFMLTLLGLTAGYIRLDAHTQGYLTGFLLAGVIAILLLCAGVIWWTM